MFRIAFESINFNHNQTDRFRNKFGMTNFVYFHHSFCHSERSEESPDLSGLDRTHSLVGEGRVRYEQPLIPNVINNHVIASPSGRGNPVV